MNKRKKVRKLIKNLSQEDKDFSTIAVHFYNQE